MPLSEHEQRLLEQMERALYAEDPKFATSMRSARGGAGDRERIAVGVVAVLVGLGLLIAGVAAKLVVVGVLGFLAMLGGTLAGDQLHARRRRSRLPPRAPVAPRPRPTSPAGRRSLRSKKRSGESLSDRMEERWRRRRETGDF